MRIGVVDLGSLSLRFDVYQLAAGKVPELIFRYRSMPRLGERLYAGQSVDPTTIERVVGEFRKIRDAADEHKVDRIAAVGTSAVREAADTSPLLLEIEKYSGISVRPLSGLEEARITAVGILENETDLSDELVLVDIGGGSTEFNFAAGKQLLDSFSVDAGASRLQQMFLAARDPQTGLYNPDSVEALRSHAKMVLAAIAEKIKNFRPTQAIGSSGTIRALERLHLTVSTDKPIIPLETLRAFNLRMLTLQTEDLRQLPGMESSRADVIIPGALLLEQILDCLGMKSIRVTHFSLRHGVLAEEIKKAR